jgi:hypothetical protein
MGRQKRPTAEVLEEEKAMVSALVAVFSAHQRNPFLPRLARGNAATEAGNLHQGGLRAALCVAVAAAVNTVRSKSTQATVQKALLDPTSDEQIGRELEKLSGPQLKEGERCRCTDHAAFKTFAASYGIEMVTRRETRSQELPVQGGLAAAASSSTGPCDDGSMSDAACPEPVQTRAGERAADDGRAREESRGALAAVLGALHADELRALGALLPPEVATALVAGHAASTVSVQHIAVGFSPEQRAAVVLGTLAEHDAAAAIGALLPPPMAAAVVAGHAANNASVQHVAAAISPAQRAAVALDALTDPAVAAAVGARVSPQAAAAVVAGHAASTVSVRPTTRYWGPG